MSNRHIPTENNWFHKVKWVLVYFTGYGDEYPWQVSDGPVGNRTMSYDFKTKAEAEVWLKEQGVTSWQTSTN